VLGVEQWAEIRRMHLVEQVPIKEIVRRTGLARNTVRAALRSKAPPRYERQGRPSKLEPFKPQIEELLRGDPRLPVRRIGELIAESGYEGGRTILADWLREVRPRFAPPRTYQRTSYRPGEILQFDLVEPRAKIPVGHGQCRRAWVLTAALGYSRAASGALIFSRQIPDLIWGMSRCISRLGALPETVVWDREGAIHAGAGRPTEAFAAFCGALPVAWHILEGVQGGAGAPPPLYAHQFRARPQLPQPRSLSGRARPLDGQGKRTRARHPSRAACRPPHGRAPPHASASKPDAAHRSALCDAGANSALPALRHQRLLPGSARRRHAGRGPRRPAHGSRRLS
jgi:transposase